MFQNYDEALRRLLVHEGGYSNDKNDPGGPTNFGITIFDYRKYINAKGTADDVRNMTVDQAKIIYAERYAKPLRFYPMQTALLQLPGGVDHATFDYGVNSGISRSAKVIQRIAGVTVDGEIGEDTLRAVVARDPKVLVGAICDERLAFLKSLSTWSDFGNGWGRRVSEVRSAALVMAGKTQQVIPNIGITPPVAASTQPPWMQRLDALMGLYEFDGARDNPAILAMAKACGGYIAREYTHDSIPWCALNENYILITAGQPGTGTLLALDFRDYGRKLDGPAYGAIATKTRDGGGHVFNVVGRTIDGEIVGRGGNQADMVCDEVFNPSVLKYNWPGNYPMPNAIGMGSLPVVKPAPHVHKEFAELPPLTAPMPGEVMAKGTPKAPPIKTAVGTTGTGGALVASSQAPWIFEHPILGGAAIVGGAAVLGVAAYAAYRAHKAHQTTPMPVTPVGDWSTLTPPK